MTLEDEEDESNGLVMIFLAVILKILDVFLLTFFRGKKKGKGSSN